MTVFFPAMRPPTHGGRITQFFGDNEKIYTAFGKRIGVPLFFHNGIDFHGRLNDPIFAPYSGKVVKKGFDPTGYGWYIEAAIYDEHSRYWGWYLLAHAIRDFLPHIGQIIYRGDQIGNVGNTGNSTGAHVHFELTINAYRNKTYEYGALGRVNPMPFLQRPVTGSGIGSHWQIGCDINSILGSNQLIVKMMEGWDNVNNLVRLLDDDKRRIIILRDYNLSVDYDHVKNNPRKAGWAHATFWADKLKDVPYHYRHRIFVEGLNEPPIWLPGWKDALNIYEAEKAKNMLLLGHGIRSIGDSLSVGWGGNKQDKRDEMKLWYIVSGAMLGRHEYYATYRDGPRNKKWWGWHCGRMAKHNNWPVITAITETGLDSWDGKKHIGWRDFYNSKDAYMNDLEVLDERYRKQDVRYWGMTPFTDMPDATWLNFSTTPIRQDVKAYNNARNLPRIVSQTKLPEDVKMISFPPYQAKTTSRLNLRVGPMTVASIVTTMSEGQIVTVSGKNNDGKWLYIDTGVNKGWAFGRYLQRIEIAPPAQNKEVVMLLQNMGNDIHAIRLAVQKLIDNKASLENGSIAPPEVYHVVEGVATKKDWQWINDEFGPGIEWIPPEVKKGDFYYHLQRVDVTFGISSFNVKVIDENGNPLHRLVAWAWKDAPKRQPGSCKTQLTDNWDAMFTKDDGVIGFAGGHDAWKPIDGPGPYSVWVCDGNSNPATGKRGGNGIKSVILTGIGFDKKPAYTDHHWISHVVFVLKRAE